jgi:phosphosulfolactate synthase (CoM biosynthesis protein A)
MDFRPAGYALVAGRTLGRAIATITPIERVNMDNDNSIAKNLPFLHRQPKPRLKGLNYVRAPAVLGTTLQDTLDAYAHHIDILKISGHQVSLAAEATLERAFDTCAKAGVRVAVGNPPIDAALNGGRASLESVFRILAEWNVCFVEVSGIARTLDEEDLAAVISLAKAEKLEVIYEIGVDFAHTRSADYELFPKRRAALAAAAIQSGCAYVLVESEGLTENLGAGLPRWDTLDVIVGSLDPAQVIFEADDQDIMCKLIEIYGPKANLMVDYSRIEKLEAARRGFPPSQSLWGKVASLALDN